MIGPGADKYVQEGDLQGLRWYVGTQPADGKLMTLAFEIIPLVVNCILNQREREK